MADVIVEKEFHTEIKINDVTDLFELHTNPHKFFKENDGKDTRGDKKGYMKIYKKIFKDKPKAESWHEKMLDEDYLKLDMWNPFVFRGHKNPEWKLETSLYRECTKLGPMGKKEKEDLFKKEKMILWEFKRNYNRFVTMNQISELDYYEWFSWMQHYGVPTRFLDFSRSFYVALYFASKNVSFENKETASFSIYAINRVWLEKRYKKCLPKKIKKLYFSKNGDSFGKDPKIQDKIINYKPRFKAVINMAPYNYNTRFVQQKSVFLFPTDVNSTFMENLCTMLVDDNNKPINSRVIKIDVTLSWNDMIYLYKQLYNMNVNAQTLFENKLESMGEIMKQKIVESRFSDVLSLNAQENNHINRGRIQGE